MTTNERELKPASWPLLFSYKSRVFGNGYIAEVELCGRLLAELETEGVWLYGVNPGALAVGAVNLTTANVDLHKALTGVFVDFAESARTFGAFEAAVTKYFYQTDDEAVADWQTAVERVRASATIEAPAGLPIKDTSKTKVFVRVAEQAMSTISPKDNDCVSAPSQLAAAA